MKGRRGLAEGESAATRRACVRREILSGDRGGAGEVALCARRFISRTGRMERWRGCCSAAPPTPEGKKRSSTAARGEAAGVMDGLSPRKRRRRGLFDRLQKREAEALPAPTAPLEPAERRIRRRVAKMLAASARPKLLALMDVKGFDPEDITVKVQDGKVKVSAEHEEEYKTCQGKEYNYSTVTKEICLPPGVADEEVTYSIGPTSLVRIESPPRPCPPCLLSLL
ncbi:outer dense fiber protein 1 [Paroedura picta]|uniref:outer dense fiber protein 1 n=1 Tax=Paroedura picta TaxID=143630 RepID=UPI004056AC35